MTTEILIWVAVAVVVVAAVAAVAYLVLRHQRRGRLRQRFGPEYERTLAEQDNRGAAERELLAREERVAELDIRPLAPERQRTYAARWTEVQERFVNAPDFAVTEADQLVTAVMAERGYPIEDFEQRVSDLSVGHGATLDHYRQAHEISDRAATKKASTEELRQAMVHYRALFEELLGQSQANGRASRRDPVTNRDDHDEGTSRRDPNGR
jgi:hypothetical protein